MRDSLGRENDVDETCIAAQCAIVGLTNRKIPEGVSINISQAEYGMASVVIRTKAIEDGFRIGIGEYTTGRKDFPLKE